MGSTRLATLPVLSPLSYRLYIRYMFAMVRGCGSPPPPEQLYIDFDGFFAACEEQADRRLQGGVVARFEN